MLNKEQFEQIDRIYALKEFLSVSAPDKVYKDAFYHDKDGNPVKLDSDGNVIDRGTIFSKHDFVLSNQTRIATNENDFQEIYDREFSAKELEDNSENNNLFRLELIEQINSLIDIHKSEKKPGDRDLPTLALSERFLNWLNGSTTEFIGNNEHPKHNPNLWNVEAYELFKYLYDNYYQNGSKRKLTNIWFYLQTYDPQNYTKAATKDQYKEFIKSSYGVDLKNFDKAIHKYETIEYPAMDKHRINFENSFLKN